MNKAWIGLLSGVAFLTSCSFIGEQPCYYGPPPQDDPSAVGNDSVSQRRQQLQRRLNEVRAILEERQNAEIYGSPEIMEEYARENARLRSEADSISKELEEMN